MDKKYYIISEDGKLFDLKEYLALSENQDSFNQFVESELNGPEKDPGADNNKPGYLKYARKLGFSWEENADNGLMNYDYKAELIMRSVKEYARQLVNEIGLPIYEVKGANIFDVSYPVVQAYVDLFGDRLYQFKSGKKKVAMSYDASYPQFNLAGKYQMSYQHLPFGHFSISDCYRHEQSGECMLLYRLRRFFMPDIHPYFKDLREAFEWYPKIEKQILKSGENASVNYHVAAEISSPQAWEENKAEFLKIPQQNGRPLLVIVNQVDKGLYWIANIDYKVVDKLGQSREIACIQLDVGNAKRLGICYVDKDGEKKHPVIIHSAIPGGIERYIYMMLDDFQVRFPLWLQPVQLRLLPVGADHAEYCLEIAKELAEKHIRAEVDDRAESVSKRVKAAKEDLVPYAIVVGEKEVKKGVISELEKAVKAIKKNQAGMPFIKQSWPKQLSKQIH